MYIKNILSFYSTSIMKLFNIANNNRYVIVVDLVVVAAVVVVVVVVVAPNHFMYHVK